MNLSSVLWDQKYKPHTLQGYIFHDPHIKDKVYEIVSREKSLPHIMLTGVRGTGKTTLADILLNELNIQEDDKLIINASDEASVDVIREKVKVFSKSAPSGDYRVILLDECDYISKHGQAALRKIMVDYSENCRFILTANYSHRILPEIMSRCTYKFHFKAPDRNDIAELLVNILSQENITFDLDTLDTIINDCYPDIRSCINAIQEFSTNGKLQLVTNIVSSVDYQDKLIDYISVDDWSSARKLVCENVIKDEYESLYRFIYENVHKSKKYKNQELWEEAIIIIAEHEYKNAIVADPEINAAAMFIKLAQLR